MLCPDDGTELTEESAGVAGCRRCKGRALSGHVFSEIHPGVREVLQPETNPSSGGFARPRLCPSCQRTMAPLRLDELPAWLDGCQACELLWVEKLDLAVIEGLKARRARARGAASFTPEERRHAAAELAQEMAGEQRDLKRLKALEQLLWAIWEW